MMANNFDNINEIEEKLIYLYDQNENYDESRINLLLKRLETIRDNKKKKTKF